MQERKTGEKVYYRTEDIDQTCTTNHMTDLSMLWKCLRPSPTHHVVCIPESRAPSAFGTLGLIKLKRQCEQPGFSSALNGENVKNIFKLIQTVLIFFLVALK